MGDCIMGIFAELTQEMLAVQCCLSYTKTFLINLKRCTQEQWNDYVEGQWEQFCDELPIIDDNWEKAEERVIDALTEDQYELLSKNPNNII